MKQERAPQRLPNKVTDFVLDNIPQYELLNAPNTEIGKQRFNEVSADVLSYRHVGKSIGHGGFLEVHPLRGAKDVLVKRLRAANMYLLGRGSEEVASLWNNLQDEHAMFEQYFGPEHVPHTEFVIVQGTNFGDYRRSAFLSDVEYVMLQETVKGVPYSENPQDLRQLKRAAQGITPKMQGKVDAFVEKYRRMVKEERKAPDGSQVTFDFGGEHVWLTDTNFPEDFDRATSNNQFIQSFVTEPDFQIENPQALVNFLTSTVNEFSTLHGQSWEDIRSHISYNSALHVQARERLRRIGFDEAKVLDFDNLMNALDFFPPEGDNRFIRHLNVLGITSTATLYEDQPDLGAAESLETLDQQVIWDQNGDENGPRRTL